MIAPSTKAVLVRKLLATSFASEFKFAFKIYIAATVIGTAAVLAISSLTGRRVVEFSSVTQAAPNSSDEAPGTGHPPLPTDPKFNKPESDRSAGALVALQVAKEAQPTRPQVLSAPPSLPMSGTLPPAALSEPRSPEAPKPLASSAGETNSKMGPNSRSDEMIFAAFVRMEKPVTLDPEPNVGSTLPSHVRLKRLPKRYILLIKNHDGIENAVSVFRTNDDVVFVDSSRRVVGKFGFPPMSTAGRPWDPPSPP